MSCAYSFIAIMNKLLCCKIVCHSVGSDVFPHFLSHIYPYIVIVIFLFDETVESKVETEVIVCDIQR
jgi:hypothetical protein